MENISLEEKIKKAFNIFLQEYPNARIHKIESEVENLIEVKGYEEGKEYKLKINVIDGSIAETKIKDRDRDLTINDFGRIDEFLNKALTDAGEGSHIKEWEFKHKNRGRILEVEVQNSLGKEIEYEYNIDLEALEERD